MMALWPALDIHRDARGGVAPPHIDFVLAALDDFEPTAVEEHTGSLRVFFSTAAQRDAALASFASSPLAAGVVVRTIDIPDEDWARRSQRDLAPVQIGRLTIFPSLDSAAQVLRSTSNNSNVPSHGLINLVIPPSMGFGTGHHATTRLCVQALQSVDLGGASVLDVGTGSGILAIAASCLGAAAVLGIDHDPYALMAARETLALNPAARTVVFRSGDLAHLELEPFDVVTANLTGTLLVRAAGTLSRLVKPGGTLIVSGLLADERADVRAAFSDGEIVWQREEDGWMALVVAYSRDRQPDPVESRLT